ncbi:glucosaminidase domain-containing protein [Clostridium novyi]|uniref:N-acetylmuramoyl-L-alanine amidase n=1 Tax=Clostridium novyi B str. ATCC 27606 TaxID=1443123 RepID=A0AA40M1S7_CLONO|nr:glucosaminidase domain-containing protein [Clostridium novyi]KEI08182.1 N-acetylmuramoyl-L-alanine amidase [Clostridium novyi B str. NCTC 9691]KEI11450.1 N-acetylmuramoyl-L-alanine amidase [Clostridium novyi B str. ATCC 27606]
MSKQTDFIGKIKDAAIETQNKYKIFASITIAQAILESGWGTSNLATHYNNLFGIKALRDWNGPVANIDTKEWTGNGIVTVKQPFRVYSSWAESILDHTRFLKKEWYIEAGVFKATNYIEQIKAIVAGGYCSAPDYIEKVENIIKKYNLNEVDNNMEIIRKISNYNHSSGNNIKFIVMHDTGNYKDTALANANYFGGGNRNASAHYFVDENNIVQVVENFNAAWHCGDGHGNYGITNHNSIGIELCNSGGYIAEATINNALWLVKNLQAKYNIDNDHVVRHYDASRKNCPANMSANNWAKWWAFKSRLTGNKVVTLPSASNTPLWKLCINGDIVRMLQHELNTQCSAGIKEDGWFGDTTLNKCCTVRQGAKGNITRIIQQRLISKGYSVGKWGPDGSFGQGTYNAVVKLQKDNGLSADGIVGKDTWKALFKK